MIFAAGESSGTAKNTLVLRFLVFLGVEHAIFAIKRLIDMAIPDEAAEVTIIKQRHDLIVKKAFLGLAANDHDDNVADEARSGPHRRRARTSAHTGGRTHTCDTQSRGPNQHPWEAAGRTLALWSWRRL